MINDTGPESGYYQMTAATDDDFDPQRGRNGKSTIRRGILVVGQCLLTACDGNRLATTNSIFPPRHS
jgi:hypothetical protein